MVKTVLKVDGMMCSMCESHLNDTVRSMGSVKSVKSSHTRGTVAIVSDKPFDEALLRETISKTGYSVLDIRTEPYEKKRFSIFGR